MEYSLLNNLPCARQADYLHGDHDRCLKGTRITVLDEIEFWARDTYNRPVYWLNGLAGTGKSTIAQTVAEMMFADGRLGASFFCSRDFEDRSNPRFIFLTIAVQLARRYPKFRSRFVSLVMQDREIVRGSLYSQMDKLIVQPLVESNISTIIVIDALDECKDEEPASVILSVLGKFVAQIPEVKFFITARPDPHIRTGFKLPLLARKTNVFALHEVEPGQVNSDIRQFYKHACSEIRGHQHGLDDWPTEAQLDLLCGRAAGLFFYAMATVRFIGQKYQNPRDQLNLLIKSPDSGFVGKVKLKADVTLDTLYMLILRKAFGNNCPEDDFMVQSVLGAVVFAASPLSPTAIATLLGFHVEDVLPILSSVHSLLILPNTIYGPVWPFHKSFPDFITDPARCTDSRFFLFPSNQHPQLLIGCMELMSQRLEQNMCKLPEGVTNAEVDDLEQRTEKYIDSALEYACKSWHKHLSDATLTQQLKFAHELGPFLQKKFLFWLEVLSVLGATRKAVDALEMAEKVLDVCCISLFILFQKVYQAGPR